MLRIKEYVKAGSVEEAYELLQKKKRSRIIGGMMWMRLHDVLIPLAIDISGCGLDKISEDDTEVSIGAMATLHELETNPIITSLYSGVLSRSVGDIVGVQFRNLATIGGSVYSRFGFSDVLTALLCLPCDVVLHNAGRMPLAEFVNRPYERDVLTHILIKKGEGRACYMSERKSATDFPVIAEAVSYIDGCFNISVGARPHKAKLIKVALPVDFDDSDIKEVQEKLVSEMKFGSNIRAGAEYRTLLAETFTARCMKAIREDSRCW